MMQQRFYLRGRDGRSRLTFLLTFGVWCLAGGALVFLWHLRNGYSLPRVAFDPDAIIALVPVVAYIGFWLYRVRHGHVEVTDDAVILRVGRNIRIPLDKVSSIAESSVGLRDLLGLSGLHPGNGTLLTLPYWLTKTLEVRLHKGISITPWLPFPRIRRFLLDPEDRAGFIAALRRAAPHVTIEESPVE